MRDTTAELFCNFPATTSKPVSYDTVADSKDRHENAVYVIENSYVTKLRNKASTWTVALEMIVIFTLPIYSSTAQYL